MGRLFWKLFLAFFLALVSTDLIVGNIIEWQAHQQTPVHHEASQTCAPQSKCEAKPNALKPESQPPKTVLQPAERRLFNLPLYVFIFSLVSSTIFAGVLAWSISHPIKLLLEHLKSAAEGDLLVRVSPKITASHDEFSELGEAFDLMALRLNNMIKSQSKMLHHVSHELRSPLARIQMSVGLVMQNPKKMQSSLQRVELEAVRMERMISELLEIFRFESGMQKLQKTEVDLKGLLTGIVGDVLFEKHEAKLHLDMPEDDVVVDGQLELLQRAIDNVIRNAVKYGPENGVVAIELQHSARTGEVILEVQDQGMGVEPQELEQIFRPFVRGRRASQVDGHGIGLAMTKHIVEAHGGFVKATNLNPHGFMIRIHLPEKHEPPTDQESKNWM
jgi:two-component system, OmpR family, sensor kinase